MCDTGLNMVAASAVGIFAVCHTSPAQCVSKLCMPSLLLYNFFLKKPSFKSELRCIFPNQPQTWLHDCFSPSFAHLLELVEWNVRVGLDHLFYLLYFIVFRSCKKQ